MDGDFEEKAQKKLLLEIEEELSWPSSDQWKHGDFKRLSERITEKTGVYLSYNTLKRVWRKVKYKGKTSNTTKDALARFVDYSDYVHFLETKFPKELKESTSIERTGDPSSKYRYKWLALSVLILVLVALLTWWFIKPEVAVEKIKLKTQLRVENAQGSTPHNFWVSYDLGSFDPKDFRLKVDYLHDQPLVRSKDSLSFIYLLPGHGKAKLFYKDKLLHSQSILAKTLNWEAYIKKPIRRADNYPKISWVQKSGYLQCGPEQFAEAGIDTTSDHFLNLYLMKDFGLPSVGTELSCKLSNPFLATPRYTGTVHIALWCDNGIADLHFIRKGHGYLLHQTISEETYKSKDHNLKAFETKVGEWLSVKMKLEKKTMVVYKDDQTIGRFAYQEPLGKVIGIRIGFKGLGGYIDSIKLTHKGKMVYSNNFE
jgi:hypothetical protein